MRQVLFACVHNAGRSQMAAAFFNALADPGRARAVSAGRSALGEWPAPATTVRTASSRTAVSSSSGTGQA